MRLRCADRSPLIDAPMGLEVVEAVPDSVVTVEATRGTGTLQLRSWASFRVPPSGVVELDRTAPSEGTYSGPDPRGLWWSMEGTASPWDPELAAAPTVVSVRGPDGGPADSAEVERRATAPGIAGDPVRDGGLVGTWFRPLGPGPFPGVVVVSGSEGGEQSTRVLAGLLASHGVAAMSLAYFGVAGLPRRLARIPLEYAERGVVWCASRPEVRGDRVAVLGGSRGSELALLLGASCERVASVVAYAPSGVAWPAISGSRPAWTRAGEAVPFVRSRMSPGALAVRAHTFARRPVELAPVFRWSLDHAPARISAAEIPVERVGGPVLFVSGEDDAMWDSTRLADIAVRRARAHGKEDVVHLHYPGAGHLIGVPGMVVPATSPRAPYGLAFAFGGTRAATEAASVDSWPKVLAFLGADG